MNGKHRAALKSTMAGHAFDPSIQEVKPSLQRELPRTAKATQRETLSQKQANKPKKSPAVVIITCWPPVGARNKIRWLKLSS